MDTRDKKIEHQAVTQQLYATFHIKDEKYIITLKLLCIYDWIQPTAHEDIFVVLADLRKTSKANSNQRIVDELYHRAVNVKYVENGRYAPRGAKLPQRHFDKLTGWSPY